MQNAAERVLETAREIKPHLRGWFHVVTFPLALAAGIVLVCLSPTTQTRIASAVFTACACTLFGFSALYNRWHWGPRWHNVLKRLDHSSIFLLIAGTYTPFALALLSGTSARILLSLVWGGALLGIAFRVFWIGAPRWLYLPVYLALGWAAIFWLGDFATAAGPTVLTLIIVGGGLYSVGALVYGLRKPNPFPTWLGFHEVFHGFTVVAFIAHYVGVSMLTYSGR